MKISTRSVALAIAMLTGGHAYAETALQPVGTWLTEDGRAKIRTEKCGEGNADLCGFVVWLKEPLNDKGQPRTDINNPDPTKRSRSTVGMELLEKLKVNDDGKFVGQIYNADNGKKYDVTLSSDKPTEMEVRGCLMKFLCKSQTWTKVADLPVPSEKVVQNTTKKPAAHKAGTTAAPPASTSATPAPTAETPASEE